MPKPDDKGNQGKQGNAPGQQKPHDVIAPDGTPGQMTQQEWKDRDKAAGYTRPDDDADEDAPAEPV